MVDLVAKGDFPKGSRRRLIVDRAQLTVLLVKMTDVQLDSFIDHLLEERLILPEPYPASRFAGPREGCEKPEEA